MTKQKETLERIASIHNWITGVFGLMIAVLIIYVGLIIFRVIIPEGMDLFAYENIDLFILSSSLFIGVFILIGIFLYNRLIALINIALQLEER